MRALSVLPRWPTGPRLPVGVVVTALVVALLAVLLGGCRAAPSDGAAGLGEVGRRTSAEPVSQVTIAEFGAPADLVAEVRRHAVDAARHVRDIWPGAWAGQVVVEVPADDAGFRDRSGRTHGSAQAAAVAVVPLPADRHSGPGRVIVRPRIFALLSAQGRQVVLRHELTHLASAEVTAPDMPTWLVEGLAETVAHAGVAMAVTLAASELTAEVRSARLPAALPDDAAFAATDGSAPLAYQQAWLACRMIADRIGLDGLIGFYRQVGTGGGDPRVRLADALRAFLGVTQAEFTTQWRRYLTTVTA